MSTILRCRGGPLTWNAILQGMAEVLWAPWRFEYVTLADKNNLDGCIFVELPQQSEDRKNLILHRGATAFVMLNAFPYSSGHLMVVPYKHSGVLRDLTDTELLEANKLVSRGIDWLEIAYQPQGFNVGLNIGKAGGAGIPSHLHWHVVPRWSGDTNFMTSIAEVRVLPQSLEDAYDRLRSIIEAQVDG